MIKLIELKINSSKRIEFIDLTNKIQKIVEDEKIESGLIVLFNPHTTAGITINEGFDSTVQKDIQNKLNELIPKSNNFLHLEGNSDAHIKSSIIGSSETILIENNSLVLGNWQKIFFTEFDGPRKRKIFVKIIKE